MLLQLLLQTEEEERAEARARMGLADGSRSSSERNSANLGAPYPPRTLVSGHDNDTEVDHVKDSESMQSLDHAHAGEWCFPPLWFAFTELVTPSFRPLPRPGSRHNPFSSSFPLASLL